MARPFAHHVPLQCISQRLHHVPSRQLVITSSSPSTGGVAHPPPMDGNDSDSPSNNPMLEPVLQASRSFNYAHRQVTRSLSNFETRLGSLLSAHTETQEATQEGNEWMLDTREYEFSRKQVLSLLPKYRGAKCTTCHLRYTHLHDTHISTTHTPPRHTNTSRNQCFAYWKSVCTSAATCCYYWLQQM